MTTNEIITLVFTFLGGGFASTIITWLSGRNIEKRKKKIDALKNQIDNLYGKLYFWVGQNAQCFDYYNKIHKAYDQVYVGKKWSENDLTQKRLQEDTTTTLAIANLYIDKVIENNNIIIGIIKENYAYIDIEDIEVFQQFILDYIRLVTEHINEKGTLKTPFRINSVLEETVGTISYMRPEFIKRVGDKFNLQNN